MAVLTPVGANVTVKNSGSVTGESLPTIGTGIAGEAFAAGDVIYLKSSDSRYWKAVNTAEATVDIVTGGGVAICPADAAGDAAIFCNGTGDRIDLGATAVETTVYYVSTTSGKMEPAADLATSDYKTRVGFGNAAGELVYDPKVEGEQLS